EVARLIREHVFGPQDGGEDAAGHAAGVTSRDRDARGIELDLLIGLGALVALDREDELAVQLRSAHRLGVDPKEIVAALVQGAVHYGRPAADRAVRVAQQVFSEPR